MVSGGNSSTKKGIIRIKRKKSVPKANRNSIVELSEKALIMKKEHENIKKVFNIKKLNTKFTNFIKMAEENSKKRYHKSESWFLADKLRTKRFNIGIISVMVILNLILLINSLGIKYKVYINSEFIGELDSKGQLSDVLKQASEKMNKKLNAQFAFSAKTDLKPEITLKSKKINANDLIDKLSEKSFFKQIGFAICVNGKQIVVLPREAEAKSLLEKIKEPYKKSVNTVVEFVEDVQIKQKEADNIKFPSFDEALSILSNGGQQSRVYKVEQGDTLWTIAKSNNISLSKIKEINPDLGEDIKLGQEIKLTNPVQLINVRTKEITTLKKEIPFNVIQQKDTNSYKNTKKIISKGESGIKQSIVECVAENGVLVSSNTISEKIIKQPVTQKEKIGIIKRPLKIATGAFRRPIFGFVTSRFGSRWGSVHEGIDIAGRVGQPIYAADGGKVVFAGLEQGYGKLVKINHSNGYITFYGHCSKILVKNGSRVYKGQKIALIGMTGHTTGPHLHFEIRKGGSPVNPSKFLNKA